MSTSTPHSPRTLALGWVLALDALVLLVFAAVGRRSHDEGNPVLGAIETAWPFLLGAALMHLLVRFALARAAASLPAGVVIWVGTVVIGMLLRQATGEGTAPSFIVVATCFTGFFLLGWRAVAAWVGRRRR